MRLANGLLALAIFLIGLGYLAVLPPFEGFDETAHYSSIRQIADTGTLPIYGRSFIDRRVEDYQKTAPAPWASLPPFDKNSGLTYPAFFAQPQLAASYEKDYREKPADAPFAPGAAQNWQSQHPPLYYLLMASVMRATENLPLVGQIFVLRLISFLMAFAGLMIGARASFVHAKTIPPQYATAGFLLYPFIVPMFFGEFARIGNDSLCLLLFGIIWSLTLDLFDNEQGARKTAMAIGACFGLGLLTKAFFIPILAGTALFMALGAWRMRKNRALFRRDLEHLALIVVPALLIGGGWYVYKFIAYGSLIGSADLINMAQHGNPIANLRQNFTFYVLIRSIASALSSWSSLRSWSLAHLPYFLHVPVFLLTAWIFLSYGRAARNYHLTDRMWLPVWLFAPFFAGLIYHILFVYIAIGSNGTPGWYLNILAPALAAAMGQGILRIDRHKTGRLILGILLTYAFMFLLMAVWSQMALFAGCAIKNADKYYQFTGAWFCLDHIPEIVANLAILGWPFAALAMLGAGFLCVAAGLLISRRPVFS